MSTYIKDGGTWKESTYTFIKIAGKWKESIQEYTKVNGKWVTESQAVVSPKVLSSVIDKSSPKVITVTWDTPMQIVGNVASEIKTEVDWGSTSPATPVPDTAVISGTDNKTMTLTYPSDFSGGNLITWKYEATNTAIKLESIVGVSADGTVHSVTDNLVDGRADIVSATREGDSTIRVLYNTGIGTTALDTLLHATVAGKDIQCISSVVAGAKLIDYGFPTGSLTLGAHITLTHQRTGYIKAYTDFHVSNTKRK